MTTLFGWFQKGYRMQRDGPQDFYRAPCPVPDLEASLVSFPLPSSASPCCVRMLPILMKQGPHDFQGWKCACSGGERRATWCGEGWLSFWSVRTELWRSGSNVLDP